MITQRKPSISYGHLLIKVIFAATLVALIAQLAASGVTQRHRSTRSLPVWLNNITKVDSDKNVTQQLNQLFKRVGPNMRASSDYNDYKDIKLNESILAWKLLHEKAHKIAQDQVDQLAPQVESLMQQANVTQRCLGSIRWLLKSMRDLDSRAVQSKF